MKYKYLRGRLDYDVYIGLTRELQRRGMSLNEFISEANQHSAKINSVKVPHTKPRKRKTALKSGEKFGNWTFVRYDENIPQNGIFRCVCGKEYSRYIGSIIRGESKSCGCQRLKQMRQSTRDKHIGQVYGFLTVDDIEWTETAGGTKIIRAHCTCKCGKKIEAYVSNLVSGKVKSCGCLTKIPVTEREKALLDYMNSKVHKPYP